MNNSSFMQRYGVPLAIMAALFVAVYIMLQPYLKSNTSSLNWSWGSSSEQALQITASGNGTVTVEGQALALTITATSTTAGCDYKGKWSTGDQILTGGMIYPCNNDGYKAYLAKLEELQKVGEDWLAKLRSVPFWGQ